MKRCVPAVMLILAAGCSGSMPTTAYQQLAATAAAELEVKQARLNSRVGDYHHFDWNQETGELAFSSPGKPTLVARIQFLGDVSKSSKTWLWAWENPSVEAPLKTSALAVREYGRQNRIERLTSAEWPAGEADGWEMAAIAVKVLGAEAAYRTASDQGVQFMSLTDLHEAPPGYRIDHSGDPK